ncbi:GAF domain-like protein [Fistulina hepatica ATCC 64428]|uniref:GAF domain-like protein n=1 Tax=Fistulina hepatica ATCC 64428 TaxID=1128425 RepID=A0A0D7A1H5_9AGAR|nr:GAF domain-like protein [Fistulina hepatica ATCC 64428]
MPHADASLVPETITTKTAFWEHVHEQLAALIDGQRNWACIPFPSTGITVSNLANASSLIFNALAAFPAHFGQDPHQAVNWCFYLDQSHFPVARLSATPTAHEKTQSSNRQLLLGPFSGKPACQFINTTPGRARGVCADAFLKRETVLVEDVNAYPGHIACDGETKSEIVCPLILHTDSGSVPLGVLDLDCLRLAGFDGDDRKGLEKIVALLVEACDW